MSVLTARQGTLAVVGLALALPLTTSACGGSGDAGGKADAGDPTPRAAATQAAEPKPRSSPSPSDADVDPNDFVREIDNPYLPLEPGTRLTYEGRGAEGAEEIVVEVTDETRKILGVTVTVVRDTVSRDGEVVEDTRDWFAQDREGNVWYFGEDSKELENGEVVSTEGSWEAGKDGARPGMVMKADPQVGDVYDQERAPGVAEDKGEVLSLDESVTVPYGSYDKVLKTKDTNPLEPDVVEHKFYAKGVGLLKEQEVKGGKDQAELVSVDRP